jgi:hypothetical protein
MTDWWRRGLAIKTAAVLVLSVGGLVAAYVSRLAPPYPVVEGLPFVIALDADGCPVVPDPVPAVDSPGQFVPENPVEVVLCSTPTPEFGVTLAPNDPAYVPRTRVLRTGAAEFGALFNGLMTRNEDWRDWQRKHSGLWPDAHPDDLCGIVGLLPAYEYSFVLRYADQPPVAVIPSCHGWTTGSRTRAASRVGARSLDRQFELRFAAQD